MPLPAQETLATIRTRILKLVGFGSTASTNVKATIDEMLYSSQKTLYWKYEFQRLRKKTTFNTVVGQISYDWVTEVGVTAMEPRKMIEIAVEVQGERVPLVEGIDIVHDSIVDNQYYPQRYDRTDVLELWPKPNAIWTCYLEYYLPLGVFAADGDPATLDDQLVFLSALVKAKKRYKQDDWDTYQAEFDELLHNLRVKSKGEKRFFTGRRKASKELDLRPPPVVVE